MTKINIDDVASLAEELSLIESDEDGFRSYDNLMERLNEDPEDFIVEYTQALLDHMMTGCSQLTGKHYIGFGKRLSSSGVSMFMKRYYEV